MKIRAVYKPENHQAIADENIERWYQQTITAAKDFCLTYNVFVGTEMMFTRLRVGVAEGEIDYLELFDEELNQLYLVNEYGALDSWPLYFNIFEDYLQRLMARYYRKGKSK